MNNFNRLSVLAAVGVTSFLTGKYLEAYSRQHDINSFSLPIIYGKVIDIQNDDRLSSPNQIPAMKQENSISIASNKTARIGQIMKFGFPSLDNVRSFDDYVLSYDKRNRIPNWVIEHLTPESVKFNEEVDRSKCQFHEDSSVHQYFRSQNTDYFKSGFDRGHMAAAGNHRLRQEWCEQTFVLSNMAPQVGKGFNRDTWNRLEKYTRKLTKKFPNVYVCTGPLYLPRVEDDGFTYVKYRVIGNNHVAVPTHFFKIILVQSADNNYEMEAYVLPNQVIKDDTPLTNFRVPPESVERAAGLLFFDRVPKSDIKLINGKRT